MGAPLSLLQVHQGSKAYGLQVLFDRATFAINEGEHVGVIGPNGAGKSTLFRILIGQEELDSGQVIRSQKLRVGYLSQHDNWLPDETGNTYLDRICTIPVWEAKAKGRQLRVSEEVFAKPILSLSGGYRMRIKLIGLLGGDPNLMLLDEPTNYLDLETTLLLERFLQDYEGAFLLISHDREVLRRTTDHTLEVEAGDIIKFNGHIDDYFEQKELLRSQLEAQIQNQEIKRKSILEFVERFGAKATKARQAQSRLRMLEKMESIELKPIPVTAAIRIPEPRHVGRTVITLSNCSFGYGHRKVLESVSLEIRRGDHVAVVGLNGAGKSTLLKGLAGDLEPLSGIRELGYQVDLGIFNQHVVEVLNPGHAIFQSLEEGASPEVTPQEIRDMAGSLLFSSDQISKKVSVLSGGEKSRVALGRILLKKVPLLLLDEPTNHLDFQTVEALTQALRSYSGTLIVVSHDRSFIRRVGSKILEVSEGQVFLYPGTYDEYVWSLQKKLQDPVFIENQGVDHDEVGRLEVIAAPAGRVRKEVARELRSIEKKIELVEKQIQKLEAENTKFNDEVTQLGGGDNQKAQELVQLMGANTNRIEDAEREWLELVAQRDKLTESQ